MLRVTVIVLIVCDNVFGVPVETNNENFVFAKSLINILKKSGSRITAEAKELTKDLKLVVDVLEGSFIDDYGRNTETVTNKVTVSTISTTTEEESNAILEQTEGVEESTTILPEAETSTFNTQTTTFYEEIFEETETSSLEPTSLESIESIETEPANQKLRPSSAFNSLLLQKIQEVAKAVKEGRAALEFSTKWTTEQEGFQNHRLKKRQEELFTTTDEAEAVTNDVAAAQQLQPDVMNECISRWDLEQHKFSEKKHLDGLQKELEKMEELIQILKQQQRILDNMSDVDEKYYEFLNHSMRAGNIAQQQRLLQLLEVLNSKLSFNSTNATEVEEIARLRSDVEQLKLSVHDLPNRSKEIEKKLFKEIKNQKMEIFDIKNSLQQLIKSEELAMNDSVLGTGLIFEPAHMLYDPMDPQNIRIRIRMAQSEFNELTENQQNPEYDKLNDLYNEIEILQHLVDKSFNDIPQKPETALKQQRNQLSQMKKVIGDLITKRFKTKNDFFVREPLHHPVHFVTVPKLQKLKTDEDVKTVNVERSSIKSQPRSTDSDDIMKLLKELGGANDSSTTQVVDPQQAELQKSIMKLQRTLQAMMDKDRLELDKQKQIKFIADRIKTLDNTNFQGRSLTDDAEEKIILKLLKRILQQLEKSGRQLDDSSDTENELRKLADSIEMLRPKDNDLTFDTESVNDMSAAAQFQLLSRLLAQRHGPRPAQAAPFTPQEMDFLMNRLIQQFPAPTPFVAPPLPPTRFIDVQPNFTPQQFPAATPNNNLFRDFPKSFAPPQGGYTGPGQQQMDANPEQTIVDAGPYTKQKIEDLKQQIYNLQNAISTLDNPNYVKRPEDEATIYNLEQQIASLKGIVSGLNPYPEESGNYREVPAKPDGVYDKPSRIRRSVGVTSDDDEETNRFMEQTANFLRNFIPQEETQSKLQQRSSGSYGNLHQKLLDLEKQLGERKKLLENIKPKSLEDYRIRNTYDTLPNFEIPNKLHEVAKTKKSDIFEKIITKIVDTVVDKVVIAIPIVIRKLFGITVENLADYNPSNGYSSVQSLKDLGVFGYLPLIVLKFLDGFTYFINVLKKNAFVKTFLVPILVVGGVLGLIVFLIWWMQPDDYNRYGYLNYEGDKYYDKQDYNNMYGYNTYDNSRTAISRLKRNIFM